MVVKEIKKGEDGMIIGNVYVNHDGVDRDNLPAHFVIKDGRIAEMTVLVPDIHSYSFTLHFHPKAEEAGVMEAVSGSLVFYVETVQAITDWG